MPRVTGRDIGKLRGVTEKVVVDLIAGSFATGSTGGLAAMLSVGLDYVADEVARRSGENVTSGFLQSNYGTKERLVEESLAAYLGPNTPGAESLASWFIKQVEAGVDPVEARQELAEADVLKATTEAPDWARLGFAIHARTAHPSIRRALTKMYDDFDSTMIQAYEKDLEVRGRRLRGGYTMLDLAAAYTAITEGLATRALTSSEPAQFHRLAAPMVEGVTAMMTEPEGSSPNTPTISADEETSTRAV